MSEEVGELVENRYEELIQALPGRILPKRYRIDRLLSSSPFMAIYHTFYEPEEKIVNLRIFRVMVKSEEDYQFRRFKQEVKKLIGLNHPHIAKVIDCGLIEEGLPYIILENVEGPTLEELLVSHNRLAPDQVGLVFTQLTDALEYAHEHGVLHESLKPSRVIISETEDGDALVRTAGFGLLSLHNKLGMDIKSPKLRQRFIGTAAYMSPEQCYEGAEVDVRSDIYSVGCMMYECLSGQVPFLATGDALLKMHLEKEPVPITEVRKDLYFPKKLLAITYKCLEKDLTRRYQFMKDLHSDLERNADPSERDNQTVIPEAIQKAEQRVKETKEGPLKLIAIIAASLATIAIVFFVGSYIITTTSQVANNEIWKGKLESGKKAFAEGKVQEAKEIFAEAFSEAYKFPKPDPRLATTDNEIGQFYIATGRYADAINSLQEAIATEAEFKNGAPDLESRSFELLSAAQLAKGKVKEAEASAKKACTLAEKISDESPERVYGANLQLFYVSIAQNKLPEAKAAIDKMKEAIGKTSTVLSMEIISGEKQAEALLDLQQKKYKDAEKKLQDVLGSRQEKIGLASNPSIETMINLGKLYAAQNQPGKALNMLERAYDTKLKVLGDSVPSMAELAFQISQIYSQSKNAEQTEKYLRLSYDMAEKAWGKGNQETLPYIDALGKFLRDHKQISAAEVYEVEALDIRHPERVSKLGRH